MSRDNNLSMLEAACENDAHAFWRASEYATEIDWVMTVAASKGHKTIVKMCKLRGAKDFDAAMCAAACYGHETIVRLCKKYGATDFDRAARNTYDNGHRELARMCEEFEW